MLTAQNHRRRSFSQQNHLLTINSDNAKNTPNIDITYDFTSDSASPHPNSRSLLSQYASVSATDFSSVDDIDSFIIPRKSIDTTADLLGLNSQSSRASFDAAFVGLDLVDSALSVSQPLPDLMPSEPWMLGQLTPKSAGRLSHHRESSLSSLGSAGPASPYTAATSNPHITVVDSANDGYQELNSHENNYYQLAKSMAPVSEGFYAGYHDMGQSPDTAAFRSTAAIPKDRVNRGLLPAPEFAIGPGGSHPVSVASSVASDSPATPSLDVPSEDRRRKTGEMSDLADTFLNEYSPLFDGAVFNTVPKLDRTMTDVYNDELYSPNFNGISSIAPSPTSRLAGSPTNAVFAQRLHALNNQHLNAGHPPLPIPTRERSPFRHGSPLAPSPAQDFHNANAGRFRSAQQLREHSKMEQDANALRQQMARSSHTDTPKTISPKDAILELNEPEGGANFPLFPPQDSMQFDLGVSQAHMPFDTTTATASQSNAPFQYIPSHLPPTLHIPQQYPFVSHPRHSGSVDSASPASRLGSAESASRNPSTAGMFLQKAAASADHEAGTYTCTYHGCALRFDTPALLQKHKREGHRQAHGLNGTRRPDPGVANMLNSQAGPHRCDRINPSTGKPCNTIFSRPYDLTRHEDTIHNARKMKVRCNLCTEEKTFSRADALTRHYRVCHPDIEFPGKHRRRGGVTH